MLLPLAGGGGAHQCSLDVAFSKGV
jgi:hypothetical protein